MSDLRLAGFLSAAAESERAIRVHLAETPTSASEQARGHAAYRHAVALRRALEEWVETRQFRETQTT
ncbi:MAG TPA: hypothetical protein VNJ03_14960 [Vicinamibacterales bacterium]|nr:hypothetical protein [Vicinamibacterales bacterium]